LLRRHVQRGRYRRGNIPGSQRSGGAAHQARGDRSPAITPLPGTLDGAIDKLALCKIWPGHPFDADGAESLTLHCVLEGTMCAEVDGEAPIVVPSGSALLLPIGKDICIAARKAESGKGRTPKLRVLIGSVSATAAVSLGLAGPIARPLLHDLQSAPGAAELLGALLTEVERPGLGTVLVASALMKLYLVQAARLLAQSEPGGDPRVERAIAAVLVNPGAAHSIASLADLVGMSRATFIRHFAKATGMNPMQFVAKARLDHAAELLRSTNLPVKVIAAQIGLTNRSHFSRAFRREHGMDPSAFRANGVLEAAPSADRSEHARG
jgi:AraC family transcriptional regulator, activator of mtrCDE